MLHRLRVWRRAADYRLRARGVRSTWVSAFLAASLGLSAWLAWEAAGAARSHRETARSAVRDYARVAAWQYSRRAGEELDDFLGTLFDEVPRRVRATPPDLREVAWDLDDAFERVGCKCAELVGGGRMLRLDLRTAAAVSLAEPLPLAARRTLLDTLLHAAAAERRRHGILFAPAGRILSQEAALAYALVADSAGPALAYVAVFDAQAFGAVFQRWYRQAALLPPAITGGMPNDSLVRIVVRSPHGLALFASATPAGDQPLAGDTLRPAHGALVVNAAIRPRAVSRLLIGGMPGTRLPLILVLLLLTMGVGAAALLHLRRERQLARLRDDFISGVSHELRTPLAQIRMFAELHQTGKLRSEADRERAIGVIHREAQRLTHLVDNILRFSRARFTPERTSASEAVPLAALVNEVVEGSRSLASASRMQLVTDIGAELAVRGQRAALHHVLVNLLDNATKYGPPGQTIAISAVPADDCIRIAVDDAGPGVPRADRLRIWEPYVRLERDVDARVPGTGIGLAVVAELVADAGGRVFVADSPAGGARFVVELPAAAAASPARTAHAELAR